MKKEKYFTPRKRKVYWAPSYWNNVSHSSSETRRLHGVSIKKSWHKYQEGFMQSVYFQDDWDKVGKSIAKKLLDDKNYFNFIVKETNKRKKELSEFYFELKNTNIKKLKSNNLTSLLKEINSKWLYYDSANTIVWFIGGDFFRDFVHKKINLSDEEFNIITTPDIETGVSQFEKKYLEELIRLKSGKKTTKQSAKYLMDNFGWIPFGYMGPNYWDEKYFISKLKKDEKRSIDDVENELKKIKKNKNEFKRKIKNILDKNKLSKKQLNYTEIIKTMGVWTDERKNIEFRLHYFYQKIIKELSRRYKISFKNLHYLFIEEFSKLSKNLEWVKQTTNKRMEYLVIAEFKNDKYRTLSRKESNNLIKEIVKQEGGKKEIRGVVASRGDRDVYKGLVKIVLSPKEGGKVKKNDFLVALMTTPDYIASMKKAQGFITDEGGITCHAAIVAREMNKPCIIATKNATEFLKDNDEIKLDVNKGIVKKVKN